MLRRFLLITVSLIATASAAELQLAEEGSAAMSRLPPLIGLWDGEGWMRTGPGEPQRFVSQERVESRLEGQALLIEGKHWTPDRARLVHDALAIVSYNPTEGDYYFRTQVSGRPPGDFRGRIDGDAFVWEMPTPRGNIRYTIRVVDNEWLEKGEIETERGWTQFFEMKLKRVDTRASK